MNRTRRLLVVCAASSLVAASFLPATAGIRDDEGGAAPAPVDFFRDVRPILSQHCFQCHGPDEDQRKAGLRLDVRERAFEDLGGSFAIVPGDADASTLVEKIYAEKRAMPPPGKAEPLTEAQKATLKRWVEEGAEWPDHWAFEPLTRPEAPDVADPTWARDPLDRFVMARMGSAGLEPSPEASREAWLRRVSFDLTGLPPTLEELDTFLADEGEDAHETQVDRLLASPRFGERQAVEWMDAARYADTNGNQFDEGRSLWKWREWVIGAFNDNVPFDRFTLEQLAGDLLPDPTVDQLVATGFNRNHPTNSDGAGSEKDEYRTRYVIDRVNTTATTWLGMTLGCAQCHDHKYDPLTQEDFYSFYAFFNNVDERDSDFGDPRPRMRVPNPDQAPLAKDLRDRIEQIEERLEADDLLTDRGQAAWEEKTAAQVGEPYAWDVLDAVGMLSRNGAWLEEQDDGSILATGPAPAKDVYEVVLRPGRRKVEALRLEVIPDESHPNGATGRADDGRFILNRIEVRDSVLMEGSNPPLVFFAKAQADIEQERDDDLDADFGLAQPGDIDSAIVVESDSGGGGRFGRGGWSLAGDAMRERHDAVLIPIEPLECNDSSVLKVTLFQTTSGKFKSTIGRFRISATSDERIREQLLPVATKHWSTLGPFPAVGVAEAFGTEFDPEKDIDGGLDREKTYPQPVLPQPEEEKKGEGGGPREGPKKPEPNEAEAARDGKAEEEPDADAGGRDEPTRAPRRGAPDGRTPGAEREEEEEEEEEEAAEEPSNERRQPRPRELSWNEQRTWRDGSSQSLTSEGSYAYYLTRKIVCEKASTVTLRLDGPDGVRVWLNGESVYEDAPEPSTETTGRDDGGQGGGDFEFFFSGRNRRSSNARTTRVGLRAGENDLVVKVVFEGQSSNRDRRSGGSNRSGSRSRSFTFDVTPEGEAALTYAVLRALRDRFSSLTLKAIAGEDGGDLDPASATLRRFYRSEIDSIGRALATERDRLEQELSELERDMPTTMVMQERETDPRTSHVFGRGDFRNKGKEVTPRTPSVLPAMAEDLPRDRMGLAKWLLADENPLTARVLVNRIWQQYFGFGLVATPEDFGVRGDLPTHPALLDHLAHDLRTSGWDLKALHRRIVLSATYRQDAAISPEGLRADADNRWLARGARVRLTAEMIRDNALAVSGLLVERIGGESARPYQPAGVWSEVTGGRSYRRDTDEDQYRRGLYVYWKRRAPYPSMMAFDATKREHCVVRRESTTTPLQALVLLNDPVYVEAAKMLGQRMVKEGGETDAERLAFGFRLCTSRTPEAEDVAILEELLAAQRKHYRKKGVSAKKLLSVGDAKVDEELEVKELAAWTAVGSALLSLDATLHRG